VATGRKGDSDAIDVPTRKSSARVRIIISSCGGRLSILLRRPLRDTPYGQITRALETVNACRSILAVVLTTTLDAREVDFLTRQIDEYIQVTEFMVRKTPSLDQRELAVARKLRTKLAPSKRAEQEAAPSKTPRRG
jgi:hypothetical protein